MLAKQNRNTIVVVLLAMAVGQLGVVEMLGYSPPAERERTPLSLVAYER